MERIKALWLCSWYPDKMQPQNGDFIQRHARATSLYADITTIHVAPCDSAKLGKSKIEIDTETTGNLTENILYYKKHSNRFFHRFKSVCQYFYHYKKWMDNYLKDYTPDIVHVHIAWRDGITALWIKKKYNISYLLTEHWSIYHMDNGALFQKKSFLFKLLVKKIIRNATAVLPVTEHLGRTLGRLVPSPPFRVIPNVVNTTRFHYIDRPADEGFTFIHVSTMDSNKNTQGIIDAFCQVHKTCPSARLVLIGDIKKITQTKTNNRIAMVNTLTNDEVASYLQGSDAFVLFSYTENQPCVILESLCCGVPVIASDVGGVSEIIHKDNGILIEPGNMEMLVAKMNYMIRHHPQYDRKQISADATIKYAYETVGKQINAFYRQVLSEK